MSFMNFRLSRPDRQTDRIRWNQSWERDLASVYGTAIQQVPPSPEVGRFTNDIEPHTRLYVAAATKQVCDLQNDLSKYAAKQFATDNFEQKWKTLPPKRREELVLEGLYRTAGAGPDMEGHRKYCPEMTIGFLAGGGGMGFVDLLWKMMPDDLSGQITEPMLISNDRVDELLRHSPLRIGCQIHRCYFMTMTLWNTLLAFYDRSEEYLIAKPPRQSSQCSSKSMEKAAKTLLGSDAVQDIRRIHEEFKARSKTQVNICWNCGQGATQLQPGKRLKACSACRKIGRLMWYCSRECQRRDWKDGIPIPHKQICGKALMDDKTSPAEEKAKEEKDENIIPAPDPSFKRSLALRYQISLLKSPPYPDYVFLFPPPHADKMFTFLEGQFSLTRMHEVLSLDTASLCEQLGRTHFLAMRRRALAKGDETAVRAIFNLLSPYVEQHGFSESRLKKQLESEFGVDVDTVDVNAITSPTEEELEIATRTLTAISSLVEPRSDASMDKRIPAPDPSFRRSQALIHQISFLQSPPYVDYVIMFPPPHDDQGVICAFGRPEFLCMRHRALKSGDKGAVSAMFHLLSPYANALHVPLTQLKRQLEDEYEVDIDSVDVNDVLQPTEEELEMVFETTGVFAEGKEVDVAPVKGDMHGEDEQVIVDEAQVYAGSAPASVQPPEITWKFEGEPKEKSVGRELEEAQEAPDIFASPPAQTPTQAPAQIQADMQSAAFFVVLILCCALLVKAIA